MVYALARNTWKCSLPVRRELLFSGGPAYKFTSHYYSKTSTLAERSVESVFDKH